MKNRAKRIVGGFPQSIVCCLLALFLVACASGSVVITGTARLSTDPK